MVSGHSTARTSSSAHSRASVSDAVMGVMWKYSVLSMDSTLKYAGLACRLSGRGGCHYAARLVWGESRHHLPEVRLVLRLVQRPRAHHQQALDALLQAGNRTALTTCTQTPTTTTAVHARGPQA